MTDIILRQGEATQSNIVLRQVGTAPTIVQRDIVLRSVSGNDVVLRGLSAPSGSVSVAGDQALANLTQIATATVAVSGSASQLLSSVSQAAVAAVLVSASASQTLATLTQSATGTVTGGGGHTCGEALHWSTKLLKWGAWELYWGPKCVEPPAPEPSGGGGATVQRFPRKWWDSYKEPKRKRKRVIQYAERLADAFAKAEAKDAERLAERAEALQALIEQSSFKLAYLEEAAERLKIAAQERQLAAAAELARRLEEELRDEEEAEFLLLMN